MANKRWAIIGLSIAICAAALLAFHNSARFADSTRRSEPSAEWLASCYNLAHQSLVDYERLRRADSAAAVGCSLFSSIQFIKRDAERKLESRPAAIAKIIANPPIFDRHSKAWPSEVELQKWANGLKLEYKINPPGSPKETLLALVEDCAYVAAAFDSEDLRQRLQILIGLDGTFRRCKLWGRPACELSFVFLDDHLESEVGKIPREMLNRLDELFEKGAESVPAALQQEERLFLDRMYSWVEINLPYFYLHKDGVICLDFEAREKGVSTGEYRKSHPWRADDLPNRRTSRWMQK